MIPPLLHHVMPMMPVMNSRCKRNEGEGLHPQVNVKKKTDFPLSPIAKEQKRLWTNFRRATKNFKEINHEQAIVIASLQGRLYELQQSRDRDIALIYKEIESLRQQLVHLPSKWAADDLFDPLALASQVHQKE